MRNPFIKIGKIIKYEFKHSSRILLPLYGVLLALGLFEGLSIDGSKYSEFIQNSVNKQSFEMTFEGQQAVENMVTGFLFITMLSLTVAITVITIVMLARRFKQSMLGEEAYLNLSLPATMGEQLWGRFIMDFVWFLGCGIVIFLAFLLCFIRLDLPGIFNAVRDAVPEINNYLIEHQLTINKILWIQLLSYASFSTWIITLIFVVYAISHLFTNKGAFIKVLIIIILLIINGKTINLFSHNLVAKDIYDLSANWAPLYIKNTVATIVNNLVWSVIYFGTTQYIFTKKLNLE